MFFSSRWPEAFCLGVLNDIFRGFTTGLWQLSLRFFFRFFFATFFFHLDFGLLSFSPVLFVFHGLNWYPFRFMFPTPYHHPTPPCSLGPPFVSLFDNDRSWSSFFPRHLPFSPSGLVFPPWMSD